MIPFSIEFGRERNVTDMRNSIIHLITLLSVVQGVQDDICTMQPTVDGIVSVAAVLRSHANPLFAERLQADVEAMSKRWTAVIDASRQHTARLTVAVDQTRAAFDQVAALEAWLDDVTRAHLTREYTVHSDLELQQFTNNFQACNRLQL